MTRSMTRLIPLTLLLLGSLIQAHAVVALRWLNRTHNFGAFREESGKVHATFRAVNTGSEPLIVLDARANCGCTHPTYNSEPVQPRDTFTIHVAYDPAGRPGRFHKEVKVTTNAETSSLSISGTVMGAPATLASRYPVAATEQARISNDIVSFGSTVRGRTLAGAVNIYNLSDHPISPAVRDLPPYITHIMRPRTIQPGEQGVLSLSAYTDRTPYYDLVEGTFTLIPDSVNAPATTKQIATTLINREDFRHLTPEQRMRAPRLELSTSEVDLGNIISTNPIQRNITLTNTGAEPLIIRRFYCTDPCVTLQCPVKKLNPGKSTQLSLTIHPGLIPHGQLLNTRAALITNAPDASRRNIDIIGTLNL